ncbi:uncharacterized protein NPIL_609141 [Nephila pilipes]|uniref:Uncharacterized protein n=1 Tax=Nephila pilipes TaxID=299642 RepID=A0A8X6MN36_NEPPI|nr:uncharacterized protein NPIL_609141 [Nephila pilipes]
MDAIGAHEKDIHDYFSFRLNGALSLIYGLKQSRSGISSISSSDVSIENNKTLSKRRIPVCILHNSAMKKDIRHSPEIVGDRCQRSKCRKLKCNALITVRCSSCKILL